MSDDLLRRPGPYPKVLGTVEAMEQSVRLRLPPELHRLVLEAAEAQSVTRPEMVRRIINDWRATRA